MAYSSFPDWAFLDTTVFRGDDDDDSFPADQPTEAGSTNSRGDAIRVCFQLHAPPRLSRLYLSWPDCKGHPDRFAVVAAHRDAVLLQMIYPGIPDPDGYPIFMHDYFLYTVGAGGSSRSPSLDRISSVDGDMDEFRFLVASGGYSFTNQRSRRQDGQDIAVLRRGEGFAVAELQIDTRFPKLHVFKPGGRAGRWEVKHPRVNHDDSVDMNSVLWYWRGDKAFAFGSHLCWVDYGVGAMFLCKVLDDDDDDPAVRLRHLPLPATLPGTDPNYAQYHAMGVDEDRGVLRFVVVSDGDGSMIEHHFARVPFSFTGLYFPIVQRPGTVGFRDCDMHGAGGH